MIILNNLTAGSLAKFCQELQIKTSGTKKELIKRLLPLKDLFDRRVNSICKEYKISIALSREDIPLPTAGWKCDTLLFPKVQKEVIKNINHRNGKEWWGSFARLKECSLEKNENYIGFHGWQQTIRQTNHFKKLFIESNLDSYSSFPRQHSS